MFGKMVTVALAIGTAHLGAEAAGKEAAEIPSHALSGTQKDLSRTLDDQKTPYTITAEYFVDAGAELIIKPGVTLVFAKNAGLTVQGALRMEGTVEGPIVCKGSSSGIGVWQGIKVCPGATADIDGVSISGAKAAIRLEADSTIRKCSICKNENGIECRAGGSTLEDCYICDNRGDAISVHGTLKTIDHCTIKNNNGNGVFGWGACNMQASILSRNKKCGIDCFNGEVVVNQSVILENKKYDLKNGCGDSWDGTENYWGPAVTKMLEQKGESVNLPRIYDRKDRPDVGIVNVSNWLKEMPKDCGAREYPGMKPQK